MKRWVPGIFLLLFFFVLWQRIAGQVPHREIPVLCYHNIKTSAVPVNPAYTISPILFREHMKALKDSGYRTISPDELYQCLYNGASVPQFGLIISFDDSRAEHFTLAAPLLDSLGFKGLFFIMTVTIGKPGYLSAEQIRQLSDRGHIIGCHSYDHPDLRKVGAESLTVQLKKPKELLEHITGQAIGYFAYPYGAWNEEVIEHTRAASFKGAFQLSGKISERNPSYTIQRFMVPGTTSAPGLLKYLRSVYHPPTFY